MKNKKQLAAIVLCLAGIDSWCIAAVDDVNTKLPDAVVKAPAGVDKGQKLIIYEDEYPQESKQAGEQGICAIRLNVNSDGVVRANQLVISTGFARLDMACVAAISDPRVANVRLIPTAVDGEPATNWIVLTITWALASRDSPHKTTRKLTDEQLEVPIVRQDYDLKVGPDFYPAESLAMHQQGDCTVRAVVRDYGAPSNVGLVKSTGFTALDEACLAAVRQAPFLPGHTKHGAATNVVDITINWRLPEQ
jgi:TonB family protein